MTGFPRELYDYIFVCCPSHLLGYDYTVLGFWSAHFEVFIADHFCGSLPEPICARCNSKV